MGGPGVVGWLNRKRFEETGDEMKSQGWTPFILDSNGNGTYDAGADTATNINTLITDADGESVIVFVLADIPALVAGTLPQQRVTRLSPRPVGAAELTHPLEDALTGW